MIKRYVTFLWVAFFINACGGGSSQKNRQMVDSQMTAEIGGESYTVDVRYYMDEVNGLTVYSDKNDVTDSNGDGLIFGIFEHNGSLQFDFVENGERLGGKITDWRRTESFINGKGKLRPESASGEATSISFKLRL